VTSFCETSVGVVDRKRRATNLAYSGEALAEQPVALEPGAQRREGGGKEANPLTLRVLLGLKPIRAGETRNIVSDSSDFLGTHPSG
jgi:hypothetical protein